MSTPYRQQNGFTLVEMIMVIVLTGILGGMAAMFLNAPIRQYMDVSRRAELTDIADTALRRLARDIRTAVPNSIRVPVPGGANTFIEFLPARDGGRYRANAAGGAGVCAAVAGDTGGDALDFTGDDTCFDIIGPPMTFAAGDQIVIGSTQSNGNPPYDATATGIRRAYSGAAGAPQPIVVIPALRFPAFAELQSQRFDVVTSPVTFACIGALGTDANGNGTASLVRYAGYGFNVAQVAPPFAAGTADILANNVSGCAIEYSLPNQRNGLVSITLTLTRGGESVSLHHEIHVNNAP